MPRVTVELPGALSNVLRCGRTLLVEATTLRGALDAAIALHPPLAGHLFDETGGLRPHVLCFLNETNSRWLSSLAVPLAEGDVITILQAVSGGRERPADVPSTVNEKGQPTRPRPI